MNMTLQNSFPSAQGSSEDESNLEALCLAVELQKRAQQSETAIEQALAVGSLLTLSNQGSTAQYPGSQSSIKHRIDSFLDNQGHTLNLSPGSGTGPEAAVSPSILELPSSPEPLTYEEFACDGRSMGLTPFRIWRAWNSYLRERSPTISPSAGTFTWRDMNPNGDTEGEEDRDKTDTESECEEESGEERAPAPRALGKRGLDTGAEQSSRVTKVARSQPQIGDTDRFSQSEIAGATSAYASAEAGTVSRDLPGDEPAINTDGDCECEREVRQWKIKNPVAKPRASTVAPAQQKGKSSKGKGAKTVQVKSPPAPRTAKTQRAQSAAASTSALDETVSSGRVAAAVPSTPSVVKEKEGEPAQARGTRSVESEELGRCEHGRLREDCRRCPTVMKFSTKDGKLEYMKKDT